MDIIEYGNNPFKHFYANNILNKDNYKKILSLLPPKEDYWQSPFHSSRFMLALQGEIWEIAQEELAQVIAKGVDLFELDVNREYYLEGYLIKDYQGYAIEVHTDVHERAITLMYYLPKDDSMIQYGTTIAKPNRSGFISDGETYFPFKNFTKIKTVPYLPNSGVCFKVGDNSFHGVSCIFEDIERDSICLILKDVEKEKEIQEKREKKGYKRII